MKRRLIYLVFECDEWKSWSSMRLALATTSQRRLKSFLAEKVERGDFSYSGEGNTARRNAAAFKKDFDIKPRDILNSMLTYGFIDYVYDGVEA